MSDRLRTVLADADMIYAEDTRRARKLLAALEVTTPLRSYFVGNEERRSGELRQRLEAGESVALISDAGMPTISDPGLTAVRAAHDADAEVSVVPGPSAVTSALAVSGFPTERFVFEGFLPRKQRDREVRLADLADESRTAVLFSGKSRVVADLADLAAAVGGHREIVVARELTKVYEEIWRGNLQEAADHWATREPRGEFTLVLAGAKREEADLDRIAAKTVDAIEAGESMAAAVRRIAAETGISRRELYQVVLDARR